VRVPTSVLLAVLAAASLLALAPALVRRYDATERLVAERATSTARVLARRRRRRTVPGRAPINPPRLALGARDGFRLATVAGAGGPVPLRNDGPKRASRQFEPRRRVAPGKVAPGKAAARARRAPTPVHRRRRVLSALVLLNLVELGGVGLVGPGFWIGFVVTFALLAVYVVHLRNRALVAARVRRAEFRRAAWVAAQQAAVRREHARRAAERREAARRAAAEREAARREAREKATEYVERYARLDRAVGEDGDRPAGLRGRPYEYGGQ
jgi:hypothetical protein